VTDVTPAAGQIWQDNDPRVSTGYRGKRLVQVLSVDDDGKATCAAWYPDFDPAKRRVRIRLDRFRPTSTGYKFVSDGGAS
jgi:hypothetical protein